MKQSLLLLALFSLVPVYCHMPSIQEETAEEVAEWGKSAADKSN